MSEQPPDRIQQMVRLMSDMPEEHREKLLELARALCRPVRCTVSKTSDIATAPFITDFSDRLRLFHATHDAALTKKTFEYLFCGASRASGRTAVQTQNSVHSGEDVIVDGRKFSLKTEGGKGISRTAVHISKLMEARGIRDCRTADDFVAFAKKNIFDHLQHYERILSLRSFEDLDRAVVEYELVEVPRDLLLRVSTLRPIDFSPRTKNGSSSATVRTEKGIAGFVLSLDGSVEKVTIRALSVDLCHVHARFWVDALR